MNILIVGGGGVGGFIAAKLSENFPTTLYSKSLTHLFLVENDRKKQYFPTITHTPPKENFDLVIFATKSYVLSNYAQELKTVINEKTKILPLLNGVWPYEELKRNYPNTLKGAIYILSNKIAPNTIELKGKGALVVTEDQEVADILQQTGIKVKVPKNIDKAIWQKYLFIATTAALTTFYDATFGEIATNHLEEFEVIVDEIIKTANEKGINLDKEDKKRALELLQKSPANAKTSMQLDFEKGAPSEIENLLGYLVSAHTPKLKSIYSVLKQKSQF